MGEEGEERGKRDFKKKYLFCVWLFDFQILRKVKNVKRDLCGWPHLPFSGRTLWVRTAAFMGSTVQWVRAQTLVPHFLSANPSLPMLWL